MTTVQKVLRRQVVKITKVLLNYLQMRARMKMKHVTVLSIPPTLDIINSGSGFGDEVINSNEATYIELQNRCCHVNTDHEIYLVEQVNSESGDQNTGETVESSSKGRSRTKHVENWSKNVRKRKCQAGKEYTSSRGKQVSKKSIKLKKDCTGKCRYTCARTFCKEEIEAKHSKELQRILLWGPRD